MKIFKKTLLLCLGIVALNTSHAATQTIDVSTGVDAFGNLIPYGFNDDTWQMLLPGSTGFQWAPVKPLSTVCGRMVGPMTNVGPGNSIFRANFNTTACSISNVKLVVSNTYGDDIVPGFTINSGLFNYTYAPPQPGVITGYNAATFYTVNIPTSSIVFGNNTLDFTVYNWTSPDYPLTPHNFRLCAYLEITYDDLLVLPGITGPSSFCLNAPLSFTGSDGPGTASTHHWELLECDAAGNPTNPANVWISPTYNSAPGAYTFPSLSFVQCAKNYLVKLVASDNCYTQTATKIIFIKCPPEVEIGPDVYICNQGCVNVAVENAALNWTYSWTGMADEPFYIGSGPGITVCPSHTTTYCVSVTGSNGCSANDCMTVYVEQLDPSFSTTLNTTNNTYFNLFATPNQLSNFPAGFGYSWVVEELDASLNPVWSVVNPACWWNFPSTTTNNFGGVWGLVPTFSCSSVPGQFKYNTNYRVTRGVWSNNCPWDQSSALISYAKSGSGQIIITEDKHAPDYSWTMNQPGTGNENTSVTATLTDALNLYPNPVSDLLQVSYTLETNAKGKLALTDVSGKLIHTMNLSGNETRTSIDVSGYQNGVYFVHLYVNGHLSATQKLVVNH